MRIGYDGKRAMNNLSGLGSFSRSFLDEMQRQFPDDELVVFSKKKNEAAYNRFQQTSFEDISIAGGLGGALKTSKIDLYHGLSHLIPAAVQKAKIPSVLTMHDLIYLTYPADFPFFDRMSYNYRFRASCKRADRIVAISQSTKRDLVSYYKMNPDDISVIYQSCDPIFFETPSSDACAAVRKTYNLPTDYILYVSSITPRKNLLTLLKALAKIDVRSRPHLVAVGRGRKGYRKKADQFIYARGMNASVTMLDNVRFSDLPAIYQMANLFIYPSYYEGFGLPILEAMHQACPVITSNVASMPEAGGDAAHYCAPSNGDELRQAIIDILGDTDRQKDMIAKGKEHVKTFDNSEAIRSYHQLYADLLE